MKHVSRLSIVLSILAIVFMPAMAYASLAPTFNQTINPGTLSASINQAGDTTPVTSPTVSFTAQNYSFQCQTSTGTLGDSNDLLNVTNLASGINTWTLAIAATGGSTATWTGTAGSYAYNNSTGTPAGCTSGQMTVDPATGTITNDCNSSCTANAATVSLGSSAAFVSGTTNSVTLMSDSAGTAWEGYATGISLSQTIPPLTPAGSYSLPMTITLTNT